MTPGYDPLVSIRQVMEGGEKCLAKQGIIKKLTMSGGISVSIWTENEINLLHTHHNNLLKLYLRTALRSFSNQ